MNIIFSLALFLFSAIQVPGELDELDEQIYSYYQNIENREAESESLWSLITIYLDKDEYAERIIEIGRSMDVEWVNLLDREVQLHTLLHEMSLFFENEHLHLFLQLLNSSEGERIKYFNEFYSKSSNTFLKELNHSITENSSVELEDLNLDQWDFSVYLILFYTRNIDGVNSELYHKVYQNLRDFISSDSDIYPLTMDFLHASIFETLYRTRNYNNILNYYDDLISLDHFPNTRNKRNIYWSLDFALFRTGHIDLSLEVQRRHTIPLTHQLGNKLELNAILAAHGGYLYNIGRYSEARDVFTSALTDTANLNSQIKTRLLNNLSLVYYKLGESNRYIENQLRALEYAVERDDYSDQLNIYRNLHIYYRKNRNWDLALQYIDAARQLAESTDDKNELVSIIISKAVYYNQYMNDYETAYSLLTDAEELMQDITDYRLKVRALYEQADLYEKAEEYEKSLDIYRQVVSIGSENNNDPMYLEAIADLANVKLLMGNVEKSRKHIREFNIHDVTVADFYILVNARRIEAEIAFREGRYRDADRIINRVYSQVLERARNTTDIEAGYWHIEPAYLKLFQLYADLLLKQNRTSDLVNVLDQLKTINDASLLDNPLIKADMLSEEDLTENRRIGNEIDELRKKLLVAGDNDRLDLQNEISSLTAQRNQLTQQTSSGKNLFNELRLWKLQSRLTNGEMILHSTRILDKLYLLMIDNNGIVHQTLSFGPEEEKLFETAINGLVSGNTDLNYLYEIYTFLGLDALPSYVNQLVIAPDSYLYQLPLDVLPVKPPASATSYGAAEFLIERMEVRYINNLQELMRNERRGFYELDFTGIGISDFQYTGAEQLISLPKATQEIELIVQKLDRAKNKRSILESDATPQAFSSSASNSRILHLASHSKISENDPLFSTIYLHPGSSSDYDQDGISGQIFAYQLFDMNLRNDLIMLNSCESGSGDYFQGAGIMGISRALRYAGARSIILNSWSVNDQLASDFAVEFYKNINQGRSKSTSLREAKIHFLKNKNANPHFWGPYMLNGDSRPVVDPPGRNMMLALLLVLFAAGFVITHRKVNGGKAGNVHSIKTDAE